MYFYKSIADAKGDFREIISCHLICKDSAYVGYYAYSIVDYYGTEYTVFVKEEN